MDKLNLKPHKIAIEEPFNWNRVTELYNETKRLKPDEWWIVADDDELQLYSKPIQDIVYECEDSGWEFVTGGFIDRIGENGTFPKINDDSDIWKEMPNAGFCFISFSDGNIGFLFLSTNNFFSFICSGRYLDKFFDWE